MSTANQAQPASWLTPPGTPEWMSAFADHVYLRMLGSGSQKSVHLLFDNTLRRHVAVSAYTLSPDNEAIWMREARALAQVGTHPNLTAVYQVRTSNTFGLIECQFIDGRNLESEVVENALTARRTLAMAQQLAGALQHVHTAGIVHGDIKPGNVLSVGEDAFFLADFGLARLMSSAESTTAAGTPRYMAPELFAGGTASAASDAWSFGCLLYEAACGRPMFPGTLIDVIRAHAPASLPQRVNTAAAETPAPLGDLIKQLVRIEPDQRSSLANVLTVLERHRANTSVRPTPPAPQPFSESRVAQQRHLQTLLAGLEHGHGFAVCVVADDGLGKTTLVENALRSGGERHTMRITPAGAEAPAGWALQTALRNLCRGEPWSSRLHGWIASGETLGQLLASGSDDTGHERWTMLDSLTRFLAGQSLVVLIEDLEDCDTLTATFASYAGRQAQTLGLGLICTARTQAPAGAETLALEPLPDAEIHTLAAAVGEGLTRVELASIARGAKGNPMLARLLASGSQRGAQPAAASMDVAVRNRLAATPADVRVLLGIIAVLGGSTWRHVIEDILETCAQDLDGSTEEIIAEALGAGWLHGPDAAPDLLTLAQPFLRRELARHAPARQLPAITRLIEGSNTLDDDSRATLLASIHAQLPGASSDERIKWTIAAVRVHRHRGDPAAGIELAERTLRATGSATVSRQLGELQQELGECKLEQGSLEHAAPHFETAWHHARGSDNTELAARAAIGLSGGFASPLGPDFSQLLERLDQVVESAPPEPLLTVARARRCFVGTAQGLPTVDTASMAVLDDALQLESDLARAHALLACLHRNWPVLDNAELDHLMDRASCHAERLGNGILAFIMRTNRLVNTFRRGDLRAVELQLDAAQARQDLGDPALRNEIIGSRAGLALARGQLDEAAQCAASLSVDDSTSAMMNSLIQFHVLHQQGHGSYLTETIDAMSSQMPDQSSVVAYAAWHYALLDQPTRAAPLLQGLLDADAHLRNADFTWISTLAAMAEVSWLLQDSRAAAALLPVFECLKAPFVTQSFVMMYGATDHFVGSLALLTGDSTRARTALQQAVTSSARLPNPLYRESAAARLAACDGVRA